MKNQYQILLDYYESRLSVATDPLDCGALKILIARAKRKIAKGMAG